VKEENMCKTLNKLAILLILVLSFVFVVIPIISAEEIEDNEVTEDNVVENEETTLPEENEPEVPSEEQEEDTNTNEEENPPSEDKPTEEDKKEEEQPPIDEGETPPVDEENGFKQFTNWLEEIGFITWLKEELIPAIPQSFWSLLMSLLVLLSTMSKNKKASNDITTSITNMGLAKTSMDENNNLLNSIVTSQIIPAINQMNDTALLSKQTNEDMMKYKADLKAEIDRMKTNEELMMRMLLIIGTNHPELIKNGQAENITKAVQEYEKNRKEKETN
jgi:hypothetical protein